ncbi:uncharacterized protein MELLADRAFT_89116 [Melampsora larici-populina 98AG31]|uniref:Uncharacterized protein n=1 Tax=Melampsora larici-populina (strain 98AG31 / pathotype 3-4-7) TaxID=747676 RepID=F4R506_MELLP|nr:uncharacterized protein MELLADRAFT_89116 [Melampsora larici-populina 98AG31]EGG11974.1 hypothetical protein MELLADRAFT_89116 [Melampsora larici-populina 98AG31]
MRIHGLQGHLILAGVLLFEFTYGGLSFKKLAHLGEAIVNGVVGAESQAFEEVQSLIKSLSTSGMILDGIGLFGNSMPISKEALEVINKYDKFQPLKREDLVKLAKCKAKASSDLQNVNKLKAEIGTYMTQAVKIFPTKSTRQKTKLDPQAKRIIEQMSAMGLYLANMYSALNALIMHACGAAGGDQTDFKALPKAAKKLYQKTGHYEAGDPSMELKRLLRSRLLRRAPRDGHGNHKHLHSFKLPHIPRCPAPL